MQNSMRALASNSAMAKMTVPEGAGERQQRRAGGEGRPRVPRVSTDEQDLSRQEAIVTGARAAGYYVAAVYREKASGARAHDQLAMHPHETSHHVSAKAS
jgi:hypothetical protein